MPSSNKTQTPNRQRTLRRLEREWQALLEALRSVPDTDLTKAAVVQGWSVRDLIGHIAAWDREFLKAAPVILAGRRPPLYSATYGSLDAFNALIHESLAGTAPDELMAELNAGHQQVIDAVEGFPDEALRGETRLKRRLRLDTYGHYREHAAQIRAWLGPRQLADGD
jgi:uncharacterized protein (TIGR03083 family)